MADDLKRVGLVFKADGAVDFKKSLKEINSSVQENRSAFKLAQSQWDENTKTAEKLAEKQKYLAQQTKDYADKVTLLEMELTRLENAEERDEDAINKKKNQLNQAKTTLNNYKKSLEEVEKQLKSGTVQLEEYAKKIETAGEKSTELGKKTTKGLTAPIMAVGAAGVAAAMELDSGYDTIIKKTGATGETLKELNDVADDLFTGMPIDIDEAGTAVGEINTRFGATGETLRDLSEEFIKFAEINETDLNNSIGKVDKIMEQYNIDAAETGNVLGLITKKGQETGISVDTLMDSLQKNGATFKEMNLDMVQSANLLAQFEANGVNADTAIAGLRKSIKTYTDEGKSVEEALNLTIESIKNAANETEALGIAQEVFGTKGAAEMTTAIREGRIDLENISASMKEYGDVVKNTYDETLDPWDEMTVAINNLKIAGSELAESLFEVLAPIIESVVENVKEFTQNFSELDGEQKNAIVTIGLVVAAIGPMLLIFGTVAGSVSKIITLTTTIIGVAGKVPGVISTVSTGAKALWGILSANPIGVIITIILSLIVVFTTLYNKCEWFRDGVDKIFEDMKKFLNGIKNWLVGLFDFEWKLPKIKLPHFSVSGKFSLSPPSIPKFKVDWYSTGTIFKRRTILNGIGVGDANNGNGDAQEALLPIELLKRYIREENDANNSILAQMIREAISELNIVAENNIYIGDKKFFDVITEMVIKKISNNANDRRFAKGL